MENKIQKKCDLCESDSSKLIVIENTYPIVRCSNCSLIYVSQHPPAKEGKVIDEYYNGDEVELTYKAYERVNTFLTNKISSYYPNKGKFLDLGCGYADLIIKMKNNGWDGYGSELSQLAVNFVNNKLKKEIIQYGDIPALTFPKKSFTAINLTNVLEHVPSPKQTLLDCKEFLTQEGSLFIRVPNMDFSFSFNKIYKLLNLFGFKFSSYSIIAWQPPFHLTGFNSKTLKKFLEKTGYQVSYIGTSTLTAGKGYFVMEVISKIIYTITFGKINVCPTLLCIATIKK